MIPNEVEQTVETIGGGVRLVANFRITDETMPRLLVDLSDKMYNQKELAVIREYSTNAADATVKAGKPISDIQVTLPTHEDLTFRIRDFGEGLTEEKISDVYCVLGASDKRNTNLYNGMFGYGCKAGFAHSDSFTVTSWVNGEKSVYQCVKGDTRKPHSAFLLSRSASDEPSGIEVAVPVKASSMWTFHQMASTFYRYWEVLPTINQLGYEYLVRLNNFRAMVPTLSGEGWEIRPSGGSARGVAYMGYVSYPIDWEVLYHKMSLTQRTRALFELLKANNVTVFFDIGEVSFVNNREGLEYTEDTISALTSRIEAIFNKIQDSIQSKFDPMLNLWEAKKMYNSIFGTGIVEMESGENSDVIEKVRILDGNLMKLEQTFAGAFKWNGIVVDGPSFKKINRFDNAFPSIIHSDSAEPSEPVMVTYRKKNKRVKVNRCNGSTNNGITASNHVAVVINDVGVRTGIQQVARYLVFKENSVVKVVHILKFGTDDIKNSFYNEYHFDTVPILKLSDLMAPAKAWNNANKTSRSYGSGGGGNRTMKYINVLTGAVEENDVPVRDMEDGGYFIQIGYKKSLVEVENKVSLNVNEVANYLRVLVEKLGIDLERVYIINKQTSESKWFGQAMESGDWLLVWDYIKENMAVLDPISLINSEKFLDDCFVGPEIGFSIKKKVQDKNSPMLKLIELGGNVANARENVKITRALRYLHLWDGLIGNHTSSIDFEKESQKILKMYPLLEAISHSLGYTEMDVDKLNGIIKYINATDLWDSTTPEPVEISMAEPVEETA